MKDAERHSSETLESSGIVVIKQRVGHICGTLIGREVPVPRDASSSTT